MVKVKLENKQKAPHGAFLVYLLEYKAFAILGVSKMRSFCDA